MTQHVTASGPGRVAAVPGAGLVSYKTTPELLGVVINLCPSALALRRVKRLKKSVWASGHLHKLADDGFRPPVAWFVTLTYALSDKWLPCHISDATRRFSHWCKSKGVPCRYTWVAEIQPKRAERTGEEVVHYHLLAWLPVGVSMPFWDKPTRKLGGERNPFWGHGWSNTEKAKSGIGYLMKYLSKLGEFTKFPKGLRLYGIGGLNATGKSVRQWFNLPEWVKLSFGVGDIKRVASGFLVRASGEILEPAYSVQRLPGALILHRLRELPERFHAGAYSSIRQIDCGAS